MHISAIIAEYNPLHTGHQYHIEQTRLLTGADYVITVLSGDFVQRGLPAILDKHTRTRMALEAGSDLVLELPVPYALSSAEGFAFGGVSLLHQLNCVDTLSFGTESGSLEHILPLVKALSDETTHYQFAYREALKQGCSHPSARIRALKACYPELDVTPLDGASNNILAIEYCKALHRLKSSIRPVTVKRLGQGYLDTEISDGSVTSATAIRNMLNQISDFYVNYANCYYKNTECAESEMPDNLHIPLSDNLQNTLLNQLQTYLSPASADILQNKLYENALLFPNDFSNLLHYRLLTLSQKELCGFWEVTPELANKISNKLPEFQSFEQFANLLWSKDLTYARVCRCLMHILLDIKESAWDVLKPTPYARVLGFRRDSAALLSVIKQSTSIPLVTKVADAEKHLSQEAYKLFQTDLQAAHIYDSVLQHKSCCKVIHEAQKQIVII